jgi:hypothetical protein
MTPPAHGMGSTVVDALVELVNVTLRGQGPIAIGPFFEGALELVLPVLKPDNADIRPITCGSILRRLASKIAEAACCLA